MNNISASANNISTLNTRSMQQPAVNAEKRQTPSDSVELSGGKRELAEHVPGELLVRFKGAAPAEIAFTKGQNGEIVKKFDLTEPTSLNKEKSELCKVKLNGITVEEAMKIAASDESIAYAEPNYILHIPEGEEAFKQQGAQKGTNVPNDLAKELWGLDNQGQTGGKVDCDIDAPEAWALTTGKREGGPLIAVIDTGIDYNHPDLKNNIWTNPGEIPGDNIDNDGNGYVDDVHGYNFAAGTGDPMDDHSHGTHCTGTIAAEGNNGQGVTGVAWNARVMGIKFLGKNGGTTENAIESVIYATKMKADIASNSWGGGGFSQALNDAIGSFPGLFVAAAGNSSTDNDTRPHYPSSYGSDNILAVASTDSKDALSSFSCYGKESVDIAAPGTQIYSTVPGGGYASKSGTSMATPHVSGEAALIMSKYPELTPAEVKQAIIEGGDNVDALASKIASGKRINAYGGLQAAENIAAKKNS